MTSWQCLTSKEVMTSIQQVVLYTGKSPGAVVEGGHICNGHTPESTMCFRRDIKCSLMNWKLVTFCHSQMSIFNAQASQWLMLWPWERLCILSCFYNSWLFGGDRLEKAWEADTFCYIESHLTNCLNFSVSTRTADLLHLLFHNCWDRVDVFSLLTLSAHLVFS